MHSALYQHQKSGRRQFENALAAFAKPRKSLDVAQFKQSLSSSEIKQRVRRPSA
jgi:hypothetical protein